MLNKGIKFLIENKLVAVLILLLFVGWGTINAPFNWDTGFLPRNPVSVDAIPDIGENQQIVFTKWDGSSPQDIEDQITYPLTTSLLGIPGVKTIRSSSMFGFSSIYIIFEEDIEFYWSRSRILEKLNSLPSGLLPEGVSPALGPDATGLGQIFWYTLEGRDTDGNVTGGWDMQELRSIQDYYVKYALSAASGVSEVASIGGYVQEYQIDVDPELMRQYNIGLDQVVKAVKESNKDIGAQTIEINKVEYLVRGLGYLKSVADIENTVVTSEDYTSIKIKDIAKVNLGPASRRGLLDKEGAEVVGAVVVARYGANPLEVINNVKDKIKELSAGLPSKVLSDGRTSQVTIVPFYDRTALIQETLETLNEALTLEILITILVIIIMVFNLRASLLISGLLPVAVLMVFITMKLFNVDANIVALSGIAIAIGTMVDVGVILAENMIRHLEDEGLRANKNGQPYTTNEIVYNATSEVSGAIVTAVMTTIISFLPVFTMVGAEGKLFRPLAFTKTMALAAALIIALFIIPPFAATFFKKRELRKHSKYAINGIFVISGIIAVAFGYWIGLALVAFGTVVILSMHLTPASSSGRLLRKQKNFINTAIATIAVVFLLAEYWRPLGFDRSLLMNLIFVAVCCFGVLGIFSLLRKYYDRILKWALQNRVLFLTIPTTLLVLGFFIMRNTGKEFMPALNEGSFLLMPTSLPHAGIEENKRVLQQLDMAVATIPEIETVVGKAGRTESSLDPAPLSMYENVIQYKSEYMRNASGERQRYRVNDDGLFVLKNGKLFFNKNSDISSSVVENVRKNGTLSKTPNILRDDLIEDDGGEYYRNWRPEIQSPDDIWNQIVRVTKLPGVTSAPKLQPIETRLVMLQTGMRAPMGIKVKGQDLREIETFGLELEEILKQAEGVKEQAVFADRIVGKPYLQVDIKREQLARYGVSIMDVQEILQVALGGMPLTQTVEGRERYAVRVRYPRELRDSPTNLKNIYVPVEKGNPVPLGELVDIRYEQGPQVIKSEDTFLVGYVLFDKLDGFAEVDVVENAQALIQDKIDKGKLTVPKGISYQFTGTYENQLRAEKTLAIVVPLCLLIIFLILYFQFKSVTTSLMVFTGIAIAFAGGFVMIWLYGQDWFLNFSLFGENLRELFNIKAINLSVAVWVGFIALFGIATDDGVVMATYLDQSFDKEKPVDRSGIRKATRKAAGKRIRPCLMTTVTTVLALLPVLTSTGKGSDIMIPMAIPIVGGMLIDVTSYFLLPVLYSWREELQLKRASK